MNRRALLLYITLFTALSFNGIGQTCNIFSKASIIVPNRLCSPVQVNWDVTYVVLNSAGHTIEILYEWDDGSSETVTATEGPAGTFNTDANHTYTSLDDRCNYHPLATLIDNGVVCSSSSQEQIVTIWDTDNENGGEINAEPEVYPICLGTKYRSAILIFSSSVYPGRRITSIRSNNAGGISNELAVAINITSDKS